MRVRVKRPKLGGAVYILPNLITSGNIFFGFFSIVKSLQGQFVWAAAAILLAAVFDVLDGGVARLTNSSSEFGVQYDSLCDLVSFGVAPAMLMYTRWLSDYGRVGWIACFVFLACGALRLARFNVQSSIGKASGDFVGLPIPMAAGVIASFSIAYSEAESIVRLGVYGSAILQSLINSGFEDYFVMFSGPILGVLMVCNVGFRSHKALKVKGVSPFKFLSASVVLLGLVAIQPELLGFCIFFLYAASGPVDYLFGRRGIVDDNEIFDTEDDDTIESDE